MRELLSKWHVKAMSPLCLLLEVWSGVLQGMFESYIFQIHVKCNQYSDFMLKAKKYAAIILTLFLTLLLNSSLGIFIRGIFDKEKCVRYPLKTYFMPPFSPFLLYRCIWWNNIRISKGKAGKCKLPADTDIRESETMLLITWTL